MLHIGLSLLFVVAANCKVSFEKLIGLGAMPLLFGLILRPVLRRRLCSASVSGTEYGSMQSPCIYSSNEEAIKVLGNSMRVYDNFISEDEEMILLKELEPPLKRLRYEEAHWDNVSMP